MRFTRAGSGWLSCFLALAVVAAGASETAAQNTKDAEHAPLRLGTMGCSGGQRPPTHGHCRYVFRLPGEHRRSAADQRQWRHRRASVGSYEKWLSDASVTIGLFDRVELGATFQNFSDGNSGGTLLGGTRPGRADSPGDSGDRAGRWTACR